MASDFPIVYFHLSQSCVSVKDQSKHDPKMKSISIYLKGINKLSKWPNQTQGNRCMVTPQRTSRPRITFFHVKGF